MAEISALEVALSLTGVDLVLEGLGALVGVFEGAVGAAIDFQTELTRIQNNTTMTNADMGALSSGVLQLAQDSGVATDTLGTGFMKAMNIVGNTAAAMAILTVATESAVSTGGNAASTTNVLANAMHEYGLDIVKAKDGTLDLAAVQANAAHVMGVMHLAAAEGNMTLEEFSNASGRAIGVAANLGVPLDQVAAAFAALTKHGYDSATAGTQIVAMLTHMINPTKAAQTELNKLTKLTGIDLRGDFSAAGLHTKGLTGVLGDLQTAFQRAGISAGDQHLIMAQLDGSLDEATQKFIAQGMGQAQATQEAMKLVNAQRGGLGVASLLGTGAADYASILADLDDQQRVNAITQESYARTQATVGNQWARLQQIAHATAITVGGELLPALSRLLGGLLPLAQSVGPRVLGFLGDFREVIGGDMGAGTVGGTLATGFLLLRDSLIERVIPALQLLWRTFAPPGGVDWADILRRGVLGLAGGVEQLARWFQLGIDGIVTFRQALAGDWFKDGSGNAFVDTLGNIGRALRDVWDAFKEGGAGGALARIWEAYLQPALLNAWASLTGWVGAQIPGLLTTLGGWGAAFGTWAAGVWTNHLAPEIVNLWHGFIKWIEDNGPGLLTTLGTWGQQFATWAGGLWTNNLQPEIAKLWTNFTNALTGQQVDMPAVGLQGDFHAGEGTVATGGLIALFGGWLTALNNWGVKTALPVVEREITSLITAADAWIATTGYPLLKATAGKLWAAFKDGLTAKPAQGAALPIEDLAGNIIPQTSGFGFFADALNGAMDGLGNWAAGPGHAALMTVLGDLNTALLENSPAWLASWGGLWDGIKGLFTGFNTWLLDNTPTWLKTWGGLGDALGGALMAALRATLPKPIQDLLGLAGGTGAPAGNQGGAGAGTGTGPGLTPSPGGAGGGLGGDGGFTPTSRQGGPVTITINMSGPTTAELAQSMADHLYTAVSAYLAPGNGAVAA